MKVESFRNQPTIICFFPLDSTKGNTFDTFDCGEGLAAAPATLLRLLHVPFFNSLCEISLCACSRSVCTNVCLYESHLKLFISFFAQTK